MSYTETPCNNESVQTNHLQSSLQSPTKMTLDLDRLKM